MNLHQFTWQWGMKCHCADARLLPLHQEIAFATLEDDMRCAEDYVRYACRWLLQHCRCFAGPASCPSAVTDGHILMLSSL